MAINKVPKIHILVSQNNFKQWQDMTNMVKHGKYNRKRNKSFSITDRTSFSFSAKHKSMSWG